MSNSEAGNFLRIAQDILKADAMFFWRTDKEGAGELLLSMLPYKRDQRFFLLPEADGNSLDFKQGREALALLPLRWRSNFKNVDEDFSVLHLNQSGMHGFFACWYSSDAIPENAMSVASLLADQWNIVSLARTVQSAVNPSFEKLLDITMALHVGIVVLSNDHMASVINPPMAKWLNLEPGYVDIAEVSQSLFQFLSQADNFAELEDDFGLLIAGEIPTAKSYELMFSQDHKVLSLSFALAGSGVDADWVWMVQDITLQRNYQDSLEAEVEAQTAELVVEKERAEAANVAKGRFLANMSHEFRTPLHAIISFANIARKRAEDEKVRLYLDNISISGKRLKELLEKMFLVTRLESGELHLDFERVHLSELMASAVQRLQDVFLKKQIVCNFDAQQAVTLPLDRNLMEQVLYHLLNNAVCYSESGKPVSIEVLDTEDDDEVVISILDEGVGIPEDEQHTIFQTFVESSSTASQAGGVGLGLTVARGIVELHGGRLWVESPRSDGKAGSIFRLALPRVARHD